MNAYTKHRFSYQPSFKRILKVIVPRQIVYNKWNDLGFSSRPMCRNLIYIPCTFCRSNQTRGVPLASTNLNVNHPDSPDMDVYHINRVGSNKMLYPIPVYAYSVFTNSFQKLPVVCNPGFKPDRTFRIQCCKLYHLRGLPYLVGSDKVRGHKTAKSL